MDGVHVCVRVSACVCVCTCVCVWLGRGGDSTFPLSLFVPISTRQGIPSDYKDISWNALFLWKILDEVFLENTVRNNFTVHAKVKLALLSISPFYQLTYLNPGPNTLQNYP